MASGAPKPLDEFAATKAAFDALKGLQPAEQERALRYVAEKLAVRPPMVIPPGTPTSPLPIPGTPSLSRGLTAKAFLAAKKPQSDIEQIACLAFHLTYEQNTPSFNQKQIREANTAALAKSINFHRGMDNATKAGYLARAGKGNKGITALGESVVNAMPDRAAVVAAIADGGKKPRKAKKAKPRAQT